MESKTWNLLETAEREREREEGREVEVLALSGGNEVHISVDKLSLNRKPVNFMMQRLSSRNICYHAHPILHTQHYKHICKFSRSILILYR